MSSEPLEVRSPKKIEYALDELTTSFIENHDYLDLKRFDEKVKELEIMCSLAETAKEDDTCADCGELRDDCICDEDEDDEDQDEEAA